MLVSLMGDYRAVAVFIWPFIIILTIMISLKHTGQIYLGQSKGLKRYFQFLKRVVTLK